MLHWNYFGGTKRKTDPIYCGTSLTHMVTGN